MTLSGPDVARASGCSYATLHRWTVNGVLPPGVVANPPSGSGSRTRYLPDAVVVCAALGRVKALAPTTTAWPDTLLLARVSRRIFELLPDLPDVLVCDADGEEPDTRAVVTMTVSLAGLPALSDHP